ncbi:WhiB family transcriptional regulator [Streptomyces sp. NPDC101455]|uniref:WhiB family transcriptional regulator n=1 Tax=Streptomyces sp. NPDC101455 TaxID=3366142 RepID=UPI0037F7A3E6
MSASTPCIRYADFYSILVDLPEHLDTAVRADQLLLPVGDAVDERITNELGEGAGWQDALNEARDLCAGCPLLEDCLFRAVTNATVTGVVAGTTQTERDQIRKHLGLGPYDPDDLDIYLQRRRTHDTVDADRVAAMTAAGVMTQKEIAAELGCSTRTVRRRKNHGGRSRSRPRRAPLTSRHVLAAAEQLLPWF